MDVWAGGGGGSERAGGPPLNTAPGITHSERPGTGEKTNILIMASRGGQGTDRNNSTM